MDYFLKILNKEQLLVFSQLGFLRKEGFYLGGGTALALQLGHRTSVDFDFYSPKHFDSNKLFNRLENIFGEETKKIGEEEDTLFCRLNDVDCSFFWYSHPLIKKAKIIKNVSVASMEDVSAMKLIAVSRRPVKRDYIDIFYLLKTFSLEEIFSFTQKKYPKVNLYFSLRALTYFEDVENGVKREIKILDKDFSWEKAKKKIFEEVEKYQLGMIKK